MNSIGGLDPNIPITNLDRIRHTIDQLPILTVKDVQLDDSCAICFTGFASILSDAADVQPSIDFNVDGEVELGITKLVGCGHLFCRKDLVEWIRGFHGSCPTCRHIFLDIRPPSESDGESSDDDYFPNEEDEEEEDHFLDGDVDEEFEVDEMDLDVDLDEVWEDSGLTDGEEDWADGSTSFSEADMSMGGEIAALAEDVNETLCNDTTHNQK